LIHFYKRCNDVAENPTLKLSVGNSSLGIPNEKKIWGFFEIPSVKSCKGLYYNIIK